MTKARMNQNQHVSLNEHVDQGKTLSSGSALKPRAFSEGDMNTILDPQSTGLVSDLMGGTDSKTASDRMTPKRGGPIETVSPIYILVAITVGIPALLILALFGTNSGVQEGMPTAIATILVVSAFVTAMFFEIKRIADEPSDKEYH